MRCDALDVSTSIPFLGKNNLFVSILFFLWSIASKRKIKFGCRHQNCCYWILLNIKEVDIPFVKFWTCSVTSAVNKIIIMNLWSLETRIPWFDLLLIIRPYSKTYKRIKQERTQRMKFFCFVSKDKNCNEASQPTVASKMLFS